MNSDPTSPPSGEQKPPAEPAPATEQHPVDQQTQEHAAHDREDAKGYS